MGFGWTYLRRYWVRLSVGIVFSIVFALANASFVGATRTLAERFAPHGTRVESQPEATAPVSLVKQKIRELGRFVNEALDPWLPRAGQELTTRQMAGLLLFLPLLVAFRSVADYLGSY